MNSVIVLDNGRVTDADSYEHVRLCSAVLADTVTVDQGCAPIEEDGRGANGTTPSINEDQETALEQDSLRRRTGSWSVYSYYCRSAGVASVILWAIFTFVGAVTGSYTGKLLSKLCLA